MFKKQHFWQVENTSGSETVQFDYAKWTVIFDWNWKIISVWDQNGGYVCASVLLWSGGNSVQSLWVLHGGTSRQIQVYLDSRDFLGSPRNLKLSWQKGLWRRIIENQLRLTETPQHKFDKL